MQVMEFGPCAQGVTNNSNKEVEIMIEMQSRARHGWTIIDKV
jgi:hypothetical protein